MEIDRLRNKRPISRIVLNPGGKETLSKSPISDVLIAAFPSGTAICSMVCIPGSGKSSLIHARAREPMFDIYILPAIIANLRRHAQRPHLPHPRALHRTPGGHKNKNKDKDEDGTGPMAVPNSSLGRRSRDANLSDVTMLTLSGLPSLPPRGVSSSQPRITSIASIPR
ncbi:hypothetical protein FIBSPDRAFT_963366 [Athelia psychrophila]|uniref:Uncharacterized protein n=1 Tax=Athelia psychrophila TaxID=1759441 RepID=A0A165Z3E2_9AGAM|nr:hypothetical protein FIBSPDRAFT_963366 [Fibularhizoctonia sp. CBS 109695]